MFSVYNIRRTVSNRTCGTLKTLYMSIFLLYQYLVLLNMVPRNRGLSELLASVFILFHFRYILLCMFLSLSSFCCYLLVLCLCCCVVVWGQFTCMTLEFAILFFQSFGPPLSYKSDHNISISLSIGQGIRADTECTDEAAKKGRFDVKTTHTLLYFQTWRSASPGGLVGGLRVYQD